MSGALRGRGQPPAGNPSPQGNRLQIPSGGYDGPASGQGDSATGSQGRRISNPPSVSDGKQSPARSRQSSVAGRHLAPSVTPAGDPARENQPRYTDSLRNVDLPASFYNIDNLYTLPTDFKKRSAYNTSGTAVQLQLNAYVVTQYPQVKIFQYEVIIGNGAEAPAVRDKVWNSKARKQSTGPQMIYDGSRLAWSFTDHDQLKIMVDLDTEQGRKSSRSDNTFRLHIRRTKVLDPSIIQSFLEGRVQMGIPVAEAINFMDHLLRQGPSSNPNLMAIKRSFFRIDDKGTDLSGSIDVVRGIYQSMRLAEGKKLIVNLDVSNTCFWQEHSLIHICIVKCGLSGAHEISHRLKPTVVDGNTYPSAVHRELERGFRGMSVFADYDGNPRPDQQWKIEKILTEDAMERKIRWKDPVTKQPGELITIHQYFRRKYDVRLEYPHLPLVQMRKKNVFFPFELLSTCPKQRYTQKLDDYQTANMIKFAVSPPAQRLNAINEGKSWLDWSKDTWLNKYGLRINGDTIKTNARLLPAPGIRFGNKSNNQVPKDDGIFEERPFLLPNTKELVSWGVGMFPGRTKPDKPQIQKFVADFTRAYRGHGGKVATRPPNIVILPIDAGQAVEMLHQTTGNMFNQRPQLLVFLVQDKNAFHYTRIKKSSDCRYGVVSQVMQLSNVLKGSPQYYSNVCMKVNAKLGGCTSAAIPHPSSGTAKVQNATPIMIIGADVSHPSPGSDQPSMAAVAVSFDKQCSRYVAAVETNSWRVEMIQEVPLLTMLRPLINQWQMNLGNGGLPSQIYYIRDGVSESQFAQVMKEEITLIRGILHQLGRKPWTGKLTVIIASKRHHIRAFPQLKGPASDMKGNPLPGVLIERDVTMPNEWDFYLYSHIALQGTARPVHYTVLYDEADHKPEVLQNMIYEHCYQYVRSTTSVSLHPAVYYAHLASNRAKSHQDIDASAGPQGGPGWKMNQLSPRYDRKIPAPKPLLKMLDKNQIQFTMWYV